MTMNRKNASHNKKPAVQNENEPADRYPYNFYRGSYIRERFWKMTVHKNKYLINEKRSAEPCNKNPFRFGEIIKKYKCRHANQRNWIDKKSPFVLHTFAFPLNRFGRISIINLI